MISVIMPNYNGIKFIAEAIESVITQTYEDWELIVIDDCSTDDSLSVIKHYCEQDSRITVIQMNHNSGVALARNTGIRYAKGEYIALLDNDDVWLPEKLEQQIKIMSDGADIVYSSCDFINESGDTIKKAYIVPENTNYNKMLTSNVIICSSCLIKTNLLKKYSFNPNAYHEDYALWMKLLSLDYRAMGEKRVLLHYRIRDNSRSSNKIISAKKRWDIYRTQLNLSITDSLLCFVKYAINGIKKYR